MWFPSQWICTQLSKRKRQHSQINNLTMNPPAPQKIEQSRHQSKRHQKIMIGQTETAKRTICKTIKQKVGSSKK